MFQFQMSIDSWVTEFIPYFIDEIVPYNDLLMDELNVNYFAPKW